MSKHNNETSAIIVDSIVKSFKIPLEGRLTLKQKIMRIFRQPKGYRTFRPLNKVSFEIEKGEFFGIVGRNGSGKSTLLKTIAGIYHPDSGSVQVEGLLIPFIELGVGFNPDLTGKENVFLNGALLGFSRKEIEVMYDEIVDFAELHDFMEEQLKNYSSGMQVRLAFSIAVRAQGDILLLDEVLAVGDSAFQQKCYDYFERLKRENKTIILVTHSMETVKRFCSRALLLENGKVKMIGSPAEVADQYTIDNIDKKSTTNTQRSHVVKTMKASMKGSNFTRKDKVHVEVEFVFNQDVDVVVGATIIKDGRGLAEIQSLDLPLSVKANEIGRANIDLCLTQFNEGVYSINVSLFQRDDMKLLGLLTNIGAFAMTRGNPAHRGSVFVEGSWKIS